MLCSLLHRAHHAISLYHPLGHPFVSNLCLMPCFLDSIFYSPPFYNFLYLWGISFSHLEYEGYIFLRPTCQKMSLPALQVTILDVLGYSLELYSHLVTPSFQPQHEPSHLTLLISSLVLGHPCGWWKLGECASLEEHLSFLGSPTFRSYHGC